MTIDDLHKHQVARKGYPSESEIALRLSLKHADGLRYVAEWSQWMLYQDGKWTPEKTYRVFDLAREECHLAADVADNATAKRALLKASTVAGVVTLARADRRHARTSEIWDADRFALLTPDGAVDLRTGAVRSATPDDHLTKSTAVAPKDGCPIWHQFLNRITDGDIELQHYLKRLIGYGLTGCTREHVLAFFFGTGANGKSVFLNTVAGVFGDYHRTAPMEVFMASQSDRHPTELAMLRGARLVTAVETEEGRIWAESRVKSLTGGDPISARFMRQDFFEYVPQFKLLIAGNHKPQIRNVDEAMRRRLHLVPFSVTIPPEERDETLPDKLKAEWPGILDWAIEGAVEWGMTGLQPPERVRLATDDYLTAEDSLTTWIAEDCNKGPEFTATISHLFDRWSGWCRRSGEKPGSRKRFAQNLEARGFTRSRQGGTGAKAFEGICPQSYDTTTEQKQDYN